VIPFEVRLRTERGRAWRTFRDPVRVLRATRPADVLDCLEDVQRAVRRDGCYAAGFVTYEAAAAFGLPTHDTTSDPGALPLVCFGLFTPDTVASQRSLPSGGTYSTGPWEPSLDEAGYADAIRRIKGRIEAGDTYQINFTFRLDASFSGDALALLRDLDGAQDGPWGAYVDDGRHAICSASPELFFRIEGDRVTCRPMKGTAPRGLWPAADRRQAERLRASAKNRAENVMIVDMVRNDLGRIAEVGSVEVVSLFDVERYPLQWQMTSTVDARGRTLALPRIIEALFPSGSVTGAPKHSSMAIVRELESRPRGIYTGAIGYLSPNGRGHFNVAIRTIAIDRERGSAEFGVGSGVVWDSAERDEYAECLLKASILLDRPAASYAAGPHPDWQLLETIGWTPDAGFALLDRHLQRLRESAECFGFAYQEEDVLALLKNAVGDLSAPSKVRVLVSRDGAVVCEGIHLAPPGEGPLVVALAAEPVDAADVFLYHKTTRRAVYNRARASRADVDAVLLWNAAGEVTEATDANVVVELDGRTVTPPVECGLLAGTLRAELLATGAIVEQRVGVADLPRASGVWLINSVRGWMKAELR
jgi:para-aminobenzoate synthetase / 4-amino-4-deoxychorismate lyase